MAEKARSGVIQNDRCTDSGLRKVQLENATLEVSGVG